MSKKTKYLICSKKKIDLNDIDIDSKYLEQVKSYKYFGSTVNGDNSIEEEIKQRTDLSNRTYFAYQKNSKSKLLSKEAKLTLYWTIIRPVITHCSETWALKESVKRKLLITERRILRRITQTYKGEKKIKTNYELSNLIRNKNVINYLEALRLSWFGHVHRMTNDTTFKKLYECQSISTRWAGRPTISWKYDMRRCYYY